MLVDLTFKPAMIAGSNSGISFAVARKMAEAGVTVVLNSPTYALVDDVAAHEDAVSTAKVRGVFADLGNATGAEKLNAAASSADIPPTGPSYRMFAYF